MKLKLNLFKKGQPSSRLANIPADSTNTPVKPAKSGKVELHPELATLSKRIVGKLWILFTLMIVAFIGIVLALTGMTQLSNNLSQDEHILQVDLRQQNDALVAVQQSIIQQQQTLTQAIQTVSNTAQTNQQELLQSISNASAQQSVAINSAVDALKKQVDALQAMTQVLNQDTTKESQLQMSFKNQSAAPVGQKISTDYSIYSVESYGVVLQSKDGNFEIARIGKQLSIGQITAISATAVQAGDWTIVPMSAAANAVPAKTTTNS